MTIAADSASIDIPNSTNVRSSFAARSLRALERLDASLAASVLERLFLKPRRHSRPDRETSWLAGSEHFEIRQGRHRLAAWAWGDGPTLLLAHGWSGRGSQMAAFAAPLVERGFRVVTWDALGHGASRGWLSSLPAFRDGILAAAEHIDSEIYAVIAHSAGTVGTTLACHEGLDPKYLVYLAPVLDPNSFLPFVVDELGLRPEVATMTRSRVERRVGVRLATLQRLTALPPASHPLLVFHDRDDREVPWRDGLGLHRRWPGSQLVTTEGLGHRRILRDSDVIERTLEFLAPRPAIALAS